MVEGNLPLCVRHPNKRIEFFCTSKDQSERLFCSICIVKGNIQCKSSDLVDIDEFLNKQKLVLESGGTNQLPELTTFLAERKNKESSIQQNIQGQIQKINSAIQLIEDRLLRAFQNLKDSVESQLNSSETLLNQRINSLLQASAISFQNSILGNYSSFKDMINQFDISSSEDLFRLLTYLQEDAENREIQLQQRRKELIGITAAEKDAITFKEDEISAIDIMSKQLEEKLGRASMSIVTINSPQHEAQIQPPSANISSITQPKYDRAFTDIISPKSNQSFFLNRSIRSALGSASNGNKINDLRKIVCSAEFVSGHSKPITAICSYLENKVATGGEDNCIKLWDLENMECLDSLRGHTQSIRDLMELPSGIIASASNDKTIKLWNPTQGMLINTLKGHLSGVICMVYLKDNYIASGSSDQTIKFWDISTGDTLRTVSGHSGDVLSLIKTQNNLLISGSSDKSIIVWQLQNEYTVSPLPINTLAGHKNSVSTLALLSDDQTLASGSLDKTIILWNLKTGRKLGIMQGHIAYIHKLVLYSDKILLSSSTDATLKFWDTNIKKEVHSLEGHEGPINSFQILNDKSIWSVGNDMHVHVWD